MVRSKQTPVKTVIKGKKAAKGEAVKTEEVEGELANEPVSNGKKNVSFKKEKVKRDPVEDGNVAPTTPKNEKNHMVSPKKRKHEEVGAVALKKKLRITGKTPEKKQKGDKEGTDAEAKAKRKRRPGAVALREIKKYQKSTSSLSRRAPMVRLIRSTAPESGKGWRWTKGALDGLIEASEYFMSGLLEDANRMCIHAGRQTLSPSDLSMALLSNPGYKRIQRGVLAKKSKQKDQ